MYDELIRHGDVIELSLKLSRADLEDLSKYENKWVQYNKSKPHNRRKGLSLTSIDGGFSGIPDLDSLPRYNHVNDTRIDEEHLNVKTPAYEMVEPVAKHFDPYVFRSHIIRLDDGGFFPPHRDHWEREVRSFRILIPIQNCNPPQMWFMYEKKPLWFEHGQAYFINTAKEHTVFSTCPGAEFVVLNVGCNQKTIDTVLKNMRFK